MNIQQALQQTSQKLSASSSSATLDAQLLLGHVLHCNSAHLLAWPEKKLQQEQQEKYQQLTKQRQRGRPIAHLIGCREFWSLNFSVDSSTLIPRPESETLVEYILQKFAHRENIKLLDMGTGTGAIAIAIATEKPDWEIFASDFSSDALKLGADNSRKHQTKNITFIHSDWFSNIMQEDFNIIVSNPPYIANTDPHLLTGDLRYEPASALTAGIIGMDDIEHICLHAKKYLAKNAHLVIEHGYDQKQQVANCFTKNGFSQIEQKQDLSGHDRMTAGRVN